MSEDRRSQSARDIAPGPPEGDDTVRHVRWDKRLEAARARRAQVLSEKRARGDDEGQTLISRRPWEDEAAGVLSTDPPRRTMPKVPPSTEAGPGDKTEAKTDAKADAKDVLTLSQPVTPGGAAQAARAGTRASPQPMASAVPNAVPDEGQGFDRDAAQDARPRRRGGLLAAFAVGGLVAAGALVVATGWMPPVMPLPQGAPEVAPDAVTEVAPAPVPDVAPSGVAGVPETPEPVAGAVAEDGIAPNAGADIVAPQEAESVAVAEAAPDLAADPTPEPIPEPASDAQTELSAPQAVDLAALSAIALPEAPMGEGSDLALATGAIAGDARPPRSFSPPPLMSPADPVLAGLGVRAQRQAPSMPVSAAVAGGAGPATALAPRAVVGTVRTTDAPRLAAPQDPDRPLAGGDAAPGAVLAALAAPALPDAAAGVPDPAPPVPQSTADTGPPRLASAAPLTAPPGQRAAPGIDLSPPAPPLPAPTTPEVAAAAPAPENVPEPVTADERPAASEEVAAADELGATAEPEPPAPAPPRADAVLVHMLVPADGAGQSAVALSDAVAALGYTRRDPAPVNVTIRQTQVRYYHPEDAGAAELVAGAVGGPARDFTDFRPSPPDGTIEVWIEGEAPPPPTPVRAPAPVRVQPAPPPPPQPQGFCYRGEPGSPGALRVPIVDGRCAWP